ncbi:hypothetical protein EHS25_004949 [Saitozyma podzolica]|uniref:Uncharacterized protein n=1 Tax=Saitozyma podzolica TaxID=1890683 RepID=A0A427Y224_9TREE|nr:hypothetical protein EHS25_004949 [Saitozyma podzolica]
MTGSFPSLLRRSAFASYDPSITRIYTSTPSSAGKGDWGLKYALHRPRGPRYIKVDGLDGGKVLGTEWRSGEKEARWIESWGSGKVRWVRDGDGVGDGYGYPTGRRRWFDQDVEAEGPRSAAGKEGGDAAGAGVGVGFGFGAEGMTQARTGRPGTMWMEDIESMTEKEFERYLATIRSARARRPDARQPREQGSFGGYGRADLSVRLTHASLAAPASDRLHSTPHQTFGVSYSPSQTGSLPLGRMGSAVGFAGAGGPGSGSGNGTTYSAWTFPGRALDKVRQVSISEERGRQRSNYSGGDSGHPWVVSVGGATGKAAVKARLADTTETIERTDYTRADTSAGTGRFRVSAAKIRQPPMVLNLRGSRDGRKWVDRFAESQMRRPNPMDTANLDIAFELASTSAVEVQAQPDQSASASTPSRLGGPEWVAAEPTKRANLSYGDHLGVGGRREDRVPGAARAGLREYERRKEMKRNEEEGNKVKHSNLMDLLKRIKLQNTSQGQMDLSPHGMQSLISFAAPMDSARDGE